MRKILVMEGVAVVALAIFVTLGIVALHSARTAPRPHPLTRTFDTLPTGTIVVCYTPTHGDGVACVLDPAMQGATP